MKPDYRTKQERHWQRAAGRWSEFRRRTRSQTSIEKDHSYFDSMAASPGTRTRSFRQIFVMDEMETPHRASQCIPRTELSCSENSLITDFT